MILNILLVTFNNRMIGLKNIIKNYNPFVVYTISHQVTERLNEDVLEYIKDIKYRKDVRYLTLETSGAGANRLNALKNRVPASICLLSDDDVEYEEDFYDVIINAFINNRDAELITFKIRTYSGNDYKNFLPKKSLHGIFTLTNVGAIEVAFREEIIDKYHVSFDSRFGPGSIFPIGEDYIFIMDLFFKKCKMYFCPEYIVRHGNMGTGATLDDAIIIGRGAMFSRIFGRLSYLVSVVFAIKNLKRYRSKYTFLKYLLMLMKGIVEFRKIDEKRK